MELLAIALAMIVGALLKGITGMDLPPIAIPVLSVVVGVEHAVVVMALPTAVTNASLAWSNRDAWAETRDLPALIAGGVVGGVAGAWLLTALDEQVLAVVIATLVFAYIAVQVTRPQARLPEPVGKYASGPVGLAAGALQGATGLSGPVLATWLHAFRLPPRAFVLSVTLLFQVSTLGQISGLAAFSRYTPERLAQSLLACALVMAVLPLGARWSERLPRHRFDRVVLGVLAVSSVATLFDAFRT